jgi:D-ribulokinase
MAVMIGLSEWSTVSERNVHYLGIDAGTSGMRGVCIDAHGDIVADAKVSYADEIEARSPTAWNASLTSVIEDIGAQVALDSVAGVAVDGQSGTVLLCDDHGVPVSPPMFYNEPPRNTDVPSTLGRVLDLWADQKPAAFRVVHQADCLAGLLCGRFDFSDETNALKLGYNPSTKDWAFDVTALPFGAEVLPRVLAPATAVAPALPAFGFSAACHIFSGATDGMAGFVAASGLADLSPGTAVTSLGTTLVLKSISASRVDVAEFGIYSHKLFDHWVAGGASNSGGGALLRHFTTAEMTALSGKIDPDVATGLDYYPLLSSGERFPLNDAGMIDRTTPRPDDDAEFLAGLFESIARIEKRGFELLREYGVPYPRCIKTVGGGSRNKVWQKIRQRILGTEVVAAEQAEAAYGTALIARHGGQNLFTDASFAPGETSQTP